MTKAERILPTNHDAEKGLLGCILIKPDVIDEISAIVQPDDFHLDWHGVIYSHAIALHNAGKIPDATLLFTSLKKSGEFEKDRDLGDQGGMDYLILLAEREPTAFNALYYAQIVKEMKVLRSIIEVCETVGRSAYDYGAESQTILAQAETQISAISESGRERTDVEARGVLDQALQRLPEAGVAGEPRGISTGYIDLDEKLKGLIPGQVVILAGRPSMGKTALAGNIAERVSVDLGQTVVLFSLEMNLLEIADRLLFSRAKVPHHKSSTGFLTAAERGRIVQAHAELSKAKLHLDESPAPTVNQMAATCRRIKRRHGLGLIIIDYLQLVSPDDHRIPRQEQVAKIARSLKSMAKQLQAPVLCLAQLNRQTETTADHRPRLSHLRESGAIEQDADVVMFVHREEYYATTMDEKQRLAGLAEVIIAKQRNGPTGPVPMIWLADFMRFETAVRNYGSSHGIPSGSMGIPFDPSNHDYPGVADGF